MQKRYIKLWGIRGFYQYLIYEITDNKTVWYEAVPKMSGLATRIAETEEELKVMLNKDVLVYQKFQEKVK